MRAFVSTHLGPHLVTKVLADEVGCTVLNAYRFLPYDGSSAKLLRYLSWCANGMTLPLSNYDEVITEGIKIPVAIQRSLGIYSAKKLLTLFHIGEELYNLARGNYSLRVHRLYRWVVLTADVQLVVGPVQHKLASDFLIGRRSPIIVSGHFTGVNAQRFLTYCRVKPQLGSYQILFIGDVYAEWRIAYKGLDLVLDAFRLLKVYFPNLQLTVVGVPPEFQRVLDQRHGYSDFSSDIVMHGRVSDLASIMSEHSMLLLPGRGDAYPVTVLEAMAAGLIPLVSNETGNMDAVGRVAPELVVETTPEAVAQGVAWVLQLEPAAKEALSQRARSIIANEYQQHHVTRNFAVKYAEAVALFRERRSSRRADSR